MPLLMVACGCVWRGKVLEARVSSETVLQASHVNYGVKQEHVATSVGRVERGADVKKCFADVLGAAGRGSQACHNPHIVLSQRVSGETKVGVSVANSGRIQLPVHMITNALCQLRTGTRGFVLQEVKHAASYLSRGYRS